MPLMLPPCSSYVLGNWLTGSRQVLLSFELENAKRCFMKILYSEDFLEKRCLFEFLFSVKFYKVLIKCFKDPSFIMFNYYPDYLLF